jgi:hypothetical protein
MEPGLNGTKIKIKLKLKKRAAITMMAALQSSFNTPFGRG